MLTGVQHATAFEFGPLVPIDRQAARAIPKRRPASSRSSKRSILKPYTA
jgi:hypothetical protein